MATIGMRARPRRPDRSALRLTDWPAVDPSVLSGAQRETFERRCEAVQAYAQGQTLKSIVASSGIARSTLMSLVARAALAHSDGRPWGYRALMPYAHVLPYERSAPARVLVRDKAGNAGAFTQLLTRHPSLAQQLRSELTSGRVKLVAGGDTGRLKFLNGAIQRFQQACRALGLGAGDYPLNQKDKAVRSIARTLRGWLDDDYALTAHATGARTKPSSALRRCEREVAEAFDTVEFDAHKMDLRLKVILERDPLGQEHALEIERVWLLAIIDVATRCVLGWRLSFRRECDRFDAIDTFKRAIVPRSRPQLTLPGLELSSSGGFVSDALEATRFACWRQIRLDNARAHLAATSLDVVCQALGCTADFGPAYQPDDRPFIERFFGTVTATLSRRLPGSITPLGSPEQLLERLRKVQREAKQGLQLIVTAQELDELLAFTIWNYHGTPHAGLGGLTPLEMMRRHVLGIGRDPVRPRRLPELLRKWPDLLHDTLRCRVHGQIARGERPHVNFMHVRYTSLQLTQRPGLVGKTLLIHADPQDLRQLVATTEEGEILEPLQASGPWRLHAHSLWLRQAYFAAKRRRELDALSGADPFGAFLALRVKQAAKHKRAASDIARVKHEQAKPAPLPTQLPPDPPAQLAQPTGPVKARRLRIPPGFVG
ncbi:MAG TPA: hypothetical protein VLJ58_10375 [Ramlibacter sp.]|nr:hypothetical protein [Ramlibacter sp.]